MHNFYQKKNYKNCEVLLIEPPPPRNKKVLRILGSIGTYKTNMAWPPLDLAIIDGLLEKEGVDSFIFDANSTSSSWQDVADMVTRIKPRIVVFTTSTTTILNDLNMARVVKSVSGSILTAAVGTHIMCLAEETIKESRDLDIAIYNEPELVILDLVKNKFSLSSTDGIYYQESGGVFKNPEHVKTDNLDIFGIPSHHKLPLSLYHDPLTDRLPMTITYGGRGCINSCTYCCSPFYAPFRLRSTDIVIKELKWLVELGIKEIRFFDPGLTNDLVWAAKLFQGMINEKIDLTFSCEARADRLNQEIITLMKEAGCRSIDIGAETGDEAIMETIKKNTSLAIIEEAVGLVKSAGLKVMVHFMLGLPGETKKTVNRTVNFAKKIDPDFMAMGIATPHPGTPFYEFIKGSGYLRTSDWSRYDPMASPVYDYPEISGKEIFKALRYAYRSFYLRPAYILKRIREIKTLKVLKQEWRNFLGFLRQFV